MENERYILRQAISEDANKLARLASNGMPGYPFEYIYNPDEVASEIIEGQDHRIVAEDQELEIAGTAVLGRDGIMSEIKRVVVDPLRRRNGLARRMTQELTQHAVSESKNPWTDARADQIGMQRSGLEASLKPISLEPGKHVVYQHSNGETNLGAARETMVHMSSLRIPEEFLYERLRKWPTQLKNLLIQNLKDSYLDKPKTASIVQEILPSALAVKIKIGNEIFKIAQSTQVDQVSSDIDLISTDNSKMLVIKPDASGFIQGQPDQTKKLLDIAKQVGLQVVTYYCDVSEIEVATNLYGAGMYPSMIRPWQESGGHSARWEVGWRATMNRYNESLHGIVLDSQVEKEMREFIDRIQKYVT